MVSAAFDYISCCNGVGALHSYGTHQSSVLFLSLPQPPLSSDARRHSFWTTLLDLPEAAFQTGIDLLYMGYLEDQKVM